MENTSPSNRDIQAPENDNFTLYVIETACTVSWFAMDSCWMFGLVTLAQLLAVTTIASSLLVFPFTERSKANMLITAAMLAWAGMNVCWMLHDLNCWSNGLIAARVFFACGFAFLVIASFVARSSQSALEIILARFRRVKIPRPRVEAPPTSTAESPAVRTPDTKETPKS